MSNNEGRPGYRLATAKRDRHSWRPTASQWTALELHRFSDEELQPLVNRLLQRLARSIQQGTAPAYEFVELTKPKEKVRSFRSNPVVKELMQTYNQGGKGDQKTLDYLLGWALLLPPVGAVQSADEAMGLLRQFQGQRVLSTEVMRLLCEHGTESHARTWLWDLAERGKIGLVRSPRGVYLGSDKHTFEYVKF